MNAQFTIARILYEENTMYTLFAPKLGKSFMTTAKIQVKHNIQQTSPVVYNSVRYTVTILAILQKQELN